MSELRGTIASLEQEGIQTKQRLGDASQSNNVLATQMREMETKNAAVVSELRGTITSLEQEGIQTKQRLFYASQSNNVLATQMREMETKNAAVVSEFRGTIASLQESNRAKEVIIHQLTPTPSRASAEYAAGGLRDLEKSIPPPTGADQLTRRPRGSPSLSGRSVSPSVIRPKEGSGGLTRISQENDASEACLASRPTNSLVPHPMRQPQPQAALMMRMRLLEVELRQAKERIRYLEETV